MDLSSPKLKKFLIFFFKVFSHISGGNFLSLKTKNFYVSLFLAIRMFFRHKYIHLIFFIQVFFVKNFFIRIIRMNYFLEKAL